MELRGLGRHRVFARFYFPPFATQSASSSSIITAKAKVTNSAGSETRWPQRPTNGMLNMAKESKENGRWMETIAVVAIRPPRGGP
jgi:hypothetical protein